MVNGLSNNTSGNVAMDSGITTGNVSQEKDVKAGDASTAPKFGEIYKQIQAQYGAKAEKPREIKKSLGKDDFLRIMITQMKNQDPTNPFKAEQMATEMAQFTSVEQLQNLNKNVEKLQPGNSPMERMSMTGLIGKIVTVDRARFPHVEGQNENLSYTLPSTATQVRVTLISDKGEEILTKDLGPQKPGENSFAWDGLKNNTLPAKGGDYMLKIEAADESGQPMNLGSQKQARVVGVSFEGQEPIFLIGDNKSQEKITMKNIVRIEVDGASGGGGAPVNPNAPIQGSATNPAGLGAKKNNFISFQKGEGSGNIDSPSTMPPEVQEALAQYEAQKQANAEGEARQKEIQNAVASAQPAAPAQMQAANPAAPRAEGFPSGLSDPEQQGQGNPAQRLVNN